MDRKKPNIPNEIIYLITAIILLFISLVGFSDYLSPYLNFVFEPPLSVSAQLGSDLRSAYGSIGELNSLRMERNDLLVENAELKAQNSVVKELVDQLDLLKKEQGIDSKEIRIIEAEVLNSKDEEISEYLIVNVGTKEDVIEGSIARRGNLYIGMVDDTDTTRSRIKLPTQGGSSLQVVIIPMQEDLQKKTLDQVSGLVNNKETVVWRGVAVGGSTGIVVENIEKNATVKEGDHVIINDPDVGTLLYLGDLGEINKTPSDVGVSAPVTLPLNFRNILNLIIETRVD